MAEIQPDDHEKIAAVDKFDYTHPTPEQLEAHAPKAAALKGKPDAISRNCRTNYHARRSSGTRPLTQVWWVVIHCTQGWSAEAAAGWFQDPDSQGSAHSCVDNRVCFRTLDDEEIPWGAPGSNYHGYHVEQAGFVTWSSVIWKKGHRKTIQRAAYRSAVRCKRYKIPVRFCNAEMLQKGMKGITTHAECTKAFGGDHTDPGKNYPMGLLLWWTKRYLKQITKRRIEV